MPATYVKPSDTSANYVFSYEYGVLVDTAESGDPKWAPIRFISAVNPARTPKTQDAATYDDKGADNASVVGESWTLEFTVQAHRTTEGKYLAEVQKLLSLSQPDATGAKATGRFLWHDKPADPAAKPNPDDAYTGVGTVDVKRQNTGNSEIAGFTVTITGQGPRVKVKNPYKPTDGSYSFT